MEWFYHLPFPMISVEWLDVAFQEIRMRDRPEIVDHSDWLEELLRTVGLDYLKGETRIRIFGYSPRSTDLFDD